jgi:hypothetical protein
MTTLIINNFFGLVFTISLTGTTPNTNNQHTLTKPKIIQPTGLEVVTPPLTKDKELILTKKSKTQYW